MEGGLEAKINEGGEFTAFRFSSALGSCCHPEHHVVLVAAALRMAALRDVAVRRR
jgi:hypothetical protein